MKNANEIALLVAMRAMSAKKTDAELSLDSHLFAEIYCKVHPDFSHTRKAFWCKIVNGTTDFYGDTVFQLLPDCWVRLYDGSNITESFCCIAETETDVKSVMRSKNCKTMQQAFGYILAKYY